LALTRGDYGNVAPHGQRKQGLKRAYALLVILAQQLFPPQRAPLGILNGLYALHLVVVFLLRHRTPLLAGFSL
jgi:hypothetical protein